MKSVKSDKKCKSEIKYPCLMVADNGEVVLFCEKGRGVSVHGGSTVGRYSTTWHVHNFEPYEGSVCLEN